MLFMMVCEFLSLATWATLGYFLSSDSLPPALHMIPWLAGIALVMFLLLTEVFTGRLGAGFAFRDRAIFRAFRLAKRWQYLVVIALRAPPVLAAIVVYTAAAHLFGIEASLRQMFGYVPVVFFGAAVPGPMRAVAISLWVVLFPGYEGEVALFGFLQHNFFVFFNALIGLVFLRRAYRELFASDADTMTPSRQTPSS
jgi:hypothetical protein